MKTEWLRGMYTTDEEYNVIAVDVSWVVMPQDYPWYIVLCDAKTRKPVNVYDIPEADTNV
jgi:hypothetical protein